MRLADFGGSWLGVDRAEIKLASRRSLFCLQHSILVITAAKAAAAMSFTPVVAAAVARPAAADIFICLQRFEKKKI